MSRKPNSAPAVPEPAQPTTEPAKPTSWGELVALYPVALIEPDARNPNFTGRDPGDSVGAGHPEFPE